MVLQTDELKQKLKKNLLILYIWNEKRRIKGKQDLNRITDEEFIISEYKKRTSRDVDLVTPKRFTEKLQWLKLFYRDPLIEKCSDKFMARLYLESIGKKKLLNELIGEYDSVDSIDFQSLPQQFVLKVSHGSGWNIVCKDKSELNWGMYKYIIKSWLKQNLYIYGREWNYQNLSPKIIIEKYIDSGDGQLTDYKFFCFNGELGFVQVDRDRFSNHKQSYFDMEWNLLPFTTGHVSMKEEEPECFEEMKLLAKELSGPFPHVRIDFYNVGKKVYFGEFTFFDGSGFYCFDPDIWDYHWGSMLNLPKANYNQELLLKLGTGK